MTKVRVTIDVSDVDWARLRQQKHALEMAIDDFSQDSIDPFLGLLHLIDSIQDQASNILGADVVFGNLVEPQEYPPVIINVPNYDTCDPEIWEGRKS